MEAIFETISSFLGNIDLETITALLGKIDFEAVFSAIATAIGYLTEVVLGLM